MIIRKRSKFVPFMFTYKRRIIRNKYCWDHFTGVNSKKEGIKYIIDNRDNFRSKYLKMLLVETQHGYMIFTLPNQKSLRNTWDIMIKGFPNQDVYIDL